MAVIAFTVHSYPADYLRFPNSIMKNLPFTVDKLYNERNLASLDTNVYLHNHSKITSYWYPTAIEWGKSLNFRSFPHL